MRRCTVMHKDGLQPLAFRLALVEHFEVLHDWLVEPGLDDLDVSLYTLHLYLTIYIHSKNFLEYTSTAPT